MAKLNRREVNSRLVKRFSSGGVGVTTKAKQELGKKAGTFFTKEAISKGGAARTASNLGKVSTAIAVPLTIYDFYKTGQEKSGGKVNPNITEEERNKPNPSMGGKSIAEVESGIPKFKGFKNPFTKFFKNGGINPPQQPSIPKIGPKKNELGATNYPGGPDNPFVDEMSSKERSVNEMALESINKIDSIFPGAKEMLIETAIIESKIGKDTRAGSNYMQLTKKGIEGITDFKSHPRLENYYDKFQEETGIDARKATEKDWKTNPDLQAFGARLMYGKVAEPIPTTLEGRAKYWDKYYNSLLDAAGTPEEYLIQIKKYQNK